MSNPIYDMMKQMETQKDIAEINVILSGYENANGRNRALDMQASEKIREMQGKDLAIYAVTAPKPGTPGMPWSEVPPTQLYNILINIKCYLEAKLLDIVTDSRSKQTVIVKSPTGSGKTIILIDFIEEYLTKINSRTAFIWLCPGKGDLEEQSRQKMRKFAPHRYTQNLFDALRMASMPKAPPSSTGSW